MPLGDHLYLPKVYQNEIFLSLILVLFIIVFGFKVIANLQERYFQAFRNGYFCPLMSPCIDIVLPGMDPGYFTEECIAL